MLSPFFAWVKSNPFLVAGFVLIVVLFAFFFPAFYVSIDEHEYLKNATLLSNGELIDVNPLDYCGGHFTRDHYRSTYFIGKSLFLIPFLPFGLSGVMFSGLLIHLLNFVLFFLILKRLKTDSRFALLYLFFPAFVWGSRTLSSELLVVAVALAGLLFFLGSSRKEWFVSGLFFGLAALVRYDQALLFVGFAIAAFFSDRQRSKWLIIGFAIIALLIMGINAAFYGGPLNLPYSQESPLHYLSNTLTGANSAVFSLFDGALLIPAFWANLAVWIGVFLVAYPLMLLSPFFVLHRIKNKSEKTGASSRFQRISLLFSNRAFAVSAAIILSAIPLFWLFSNYSGIALFEIFSPLTITGRMRYLIPLAALFLVPYAIFLEPIFKRIRIDKRIIFIALLLVLGVGAFLVSFEHQAKLTTPRFLVLTQILENTPENALVIGSSDDCIYFNQIFSGNRQYYRADSNFFPLDELVFSSERPVYFLRLQYSNKSDAEFRQEIIDRERKVINDAIERFKPQLVSVFATNYPHHLELFEFSRESVLQ